MSVSLFTSLKYPSKEAIIGMKETLETVPKKLTKLNGFLRFETFVPGCMEMAETDRTQTRNLKDTIFKKLGVNVLTVKCALAPGL